MIEEVVEVEEVQEIVEQEIVEDEIEYVDVPVDGDVDEHDSLVRDIWLSNIVYWNVLPIRHFAHFIFE